jgi:hypothetical protein
MARIHLRRTKASSPLAQLDLDEVPLRPTTGFDSQSEALLLGRG